MRTAPWEVNRQPLRAFREGSTQSIMSMPRATYSGNSSGMPTPMAYRGRARGSRLFSAWLPNASGLPVTGGLPVVGTINDWSFGPCSGNIGVVQLDTFSWSAPTASHMTLVNCMASFGVAPGSTNAPSGWHGADTSSDGGTDGT